MKRCIQIILVCGIALLSTYMIQAQSLESSFEFLRVPISAHNASLGGHVVSLAAEDPTLAEANPALLADIGERQVGMNVMSWFAGTTVAGARFSNRFDERSSYAFHARYVSYGKQIRTEPDGSVTGSFTPKDMAIGATWAYMLSNRISGGAKAILINSRYASMSSVAIGVDLGLTYRFNGLTAGVAATNMGGQIKAFENNFQRLPFDLCAGVTWEPAHAPLRFTLSMFNLTRWDKDDFFFLKSDESDFGEILKRHVSMGVDICLTERFYIAAGCNMQARAELTSAEQRGLTGLSLGTGLKIGRVMFDLSYGKYQVSESSLLFNFEFSI